jgi:hypothetical protein
MKLPVKKIFPFIIIAYAFFALYCFAHPGKYDEQGGHFERESIAYHCHLATCFFIHEQAEKALEEAQKDKRAFSQIYRRDDWVHWSDVDNDCQDTRVEILIATSQEPVRYKNQKQPCKVTRGKWYDPYTNKTFTLAKELDIDHRIALSEAHQYGGANWSAAQKEAFANDSDNLIAVQRAANRAKSNLPTYQWMPKNIAYWCEYIQTREAVAAKYQLELPNDEIQFNRRVKQQQCQ